MFSLVACFRTVGVWGMATALAGLLCVAAEAQDRLGYQWPMQILPSSAVSSDREMGTQEWTREMSPAMSDPIVSIEYPNPYDSVTVVDMLDYMTMDSPARDTMHLWDGGAFHMSTHLWPDKIWYMKRLDDAECAARNLLPENCKAWDINLYDNIYIYGWITELDWGLPASSLRNYKKSFLNTNFPMTQRFPFAGSPGLRITVMDSRYQICTDCVCAAPQNLKNVIYETWGPTRVNRGGSPARYEDVMIVKYYWNCDSTLTSSCTRLEVNWYSKADGWIRHIPYKRSRPGYPWLVDPWASQDAWNFVIPGVLPVEFPCF